MGVAVLRICVVLTLAGINVFKMDFVVVARTATVSLEMVMP